MGVSVFAVIYDAASLAPRQLVAPDVDAELSDAAYHPPGCVQARIPAFPFLDAAALYAGCKAALPHLKWSV